jgi:hypothetical protein
MDEEECGGSGVGGGVGHGQVTSQESRVRNVERRGGI